ncbi:hypothetical protein Dsin_015956 [Dipteronia sinensis]|uniref:Secreted protein n=1 Tax=Dipteronia sinensis TaxID=43782 RepID=A0AAE0E5I7_9ROSI|nr:hypothetical protein Dsin_015956 [Dipteronia sinensis]
MLSGIITGQVLHVLFACIAVEASVYGEAEGGENDESCLGVFALFCNLHYLLPRYLSTITVCRCLLKLDGQFYSLTICLNGIDILAHQAAAKALETGASFSVVIRRIEEAFLQNLKCSCCKIIVSCSDSKSTVNMHHCCRLPRTQRTRGLVI